MRIYSLVRRISTTIQIPHITMRYCGFLGYLIPLWEVIGGRIVFHSGVSQVVVVANLAGTKVIESFRVGEPVLWRTALSISRLCFASDARVIEHLAASLSKHSNTGLRRVDQSVVWCFRIIFHHFALRLQSSSWCGKERRAGFESYVFVMTCMARDWWKQVTFRFAVCNVFSLCKFHQISMWASP